jgi:hypothetical protein
MKAELEKSLSGIVGVENNSQCPQFGEQQDYIQRIIKLPKSILTFEIEESTQSAKQDKSCLSVTV